LEVCMDLCQGMLRDYKNDIDQALMRLPDDEGELTISMSFKIRPQGTYKNEVTGTISFAKERIRDKRTRNAHEVQLEMKFPQKDGKTAAAGE
ncbi:MAG TPA: hypothetical protein VMX95_04770, partial [Thermodesulfobacteriota bacterium]|nr:hypothetical protein [Thermodesulfobacteriota bacterium]